MPDNKNQNTEDSTQNSGVGRQKTEEKKEVRTFSFGEIEFRIDEDEKPRLVGYAAKYGIFTDLGWFREKIKAGAFDDCLGDDVRCLKNHDPNLILGRTINKTLRLNSNSVGLKFENDVPDTNTGKDTLEEIRRGDISGCSFAFTVAEDDWKYFDDDRPAERTIVKIGRLFDVGPVTYPAYPDTTVAARSLEKAKEEIKNTENRIQDTEAENQENRENGKERVQNTELTFEQKFEHQKHVRKAERLKNRLNKYQQAEA